MSAAAAFLLKIKSWFKNIDFSKIKGIAEKIKKSGVVTKITDKLKKKSHEAEGYNSQEEMDFVDKSFDIEPAPERGADDSNNTGLYIGGGLLALLGIYVATK